MDPVEMWGFFFGPSIYHGWHFTSMEKKKKKKLDYDWLWLMDGNFLSWKYYPIFTRVAPKQLCPFGWNWKLAAQVAWLKPHPAMIFVVVDRLWLDALCVLANDRFLNGNNALICL